MRASYNIERIITNGTKINVKRMRRCGLLECIFLRLDWPPTHQRGKVGTYVVNHTEQFMLLLREAIILKKRNFEKNFLKMVTPPPRLVFVKSLFRFFSPIFKGKYLLGISVLFIPLGHLDI